ncbi:ATP-binding protein [Paraconexibacter antarcticus]|uniref:histidine kinase n=1 Tax=Paraconexibacter antarcticus TaxID=2949664 RepID=A0ABY5DQ77_9ACTN|nr:ATP-binding protein [Paraconexibacter antarcticus]UTI64175.1 ATP-binding protein [Paraconexibacter antarcticus]
MPRLSIATSFRAALLGLTVVLAIVAALGVAALYGSRQDYENRLSDALQLQTSAGRVLAAGVVEEATLRLSPVSTAAGRERRRRARAAYVQSVAAARDLARGDRRSLALLAEAARAQAALRRAPGARNAPLAARAPLVLLTSRQDDRIAAARASARHASRRAFTAIGVGGGLAVLVAILLVAALVRAVRSPLDELVAASRRLADGDRGVHVPEDGPEELQLLARSFNAMAADVQAATERLESERRRLDLTIRSLGDALVQLDGDGTVTAANPRAAVLVPALVPGTRTAGDDAGAALPVPLDAALREEVTTETDGRTLAVTAAALEDGGGHVLTVRDVSERARLERLKSEFVATASHELRSPLTSIKGFVELLAETQGLTDRQRSFLDIVQVSTDRLVDLVNDLLDVARVEAGAVEIHRRPTDLADLVGEVTRLLEPRLHQRAQELTVDVPADLPRALLDPARMRQVLTNLLTNAHLYTADGGRLAVRVRADRHTIRIAVEDTGRGMSAEDAEHVFDRFYRAGGGDDGAGTGLGLAIVRSLVDLHGGHIDVQSALGEGTTFTVVLPYAIVLGQAAAARDALRGKRVLIVDDEPEIAELVSERLGALDVQTESVLSGAEALARLREDRFDAITLDILMPGMSGLEVLRAIRSDPALAGLPVVVVSVFSGREALSGEWVVGKPLDPEELADTLGAALLASRVSVVVAARPDVRRRLETALDEVGIVCDWASDATDVAARCAESFYEIGVVDSGLPDAADAAGAMELRGRRHTRGVLVAVDDTRPRPPLPAAVAGREVTLDDVGAVILGLLEPLIHRGRPTGSGID